MYRDDRHAALERVVALERKAAALKTRIRRQRRRFWLLFHKTSLIAAGAAVFGAFGTAFCFSIADPSPSVITDTIPPPPPTDAGVPPIGMFEHSVPTHLMCGAMEFEDPMCRSPRLAEPARYLRVRNYCGSAYWRMAPPLPPPRHSTIAPLPNL